MNSSERIRPLHFTGLRGLFPNPKNVLRRVSVFLALFLLGQQVIRAANPIVEGRGLADPHAVVFGDRTWLYASHDADRKATKFVMRN